ncbi:MAG TPA: cytochrome c peroxidase [Polyangiaceae bacterium]|nr:cytochrome c peroxidase [Polyangiaceae bacterium]
MVFSPRRLPSRRAGPPALATLAFALLGLACSAERPDSPTGGRSTPPPDATPTSADASPAAGLVALGERLFFDARLSGNDKLSCASCHDPTRAFSDGRRVSVGVSGRPLRRNAPGLFDLAARAPYFWDGRAPTLEEQALGPLTDPDEMGQDLRGLEAELASDAGYRALFAQSFPGEGVSVFNVARALAAFERTLVSRSSPYDRYLAGDASALDGAARRGLSLFEGKAECSTCHRGPALTDNQFHRVAFAGDDPGRAALGPGAGPRGGFKTPSLREVARTAPYFHDGSVASLEEVVEHYARGGDPRAGEARDVHPLELDEGERRDLVAFLRALSSGP